MKNELASEQEFIDFKRDEMMTDVLEDIKADLKAKGLWQEGSDNKPIDEYDIDQTTYAE